MEICRSTNDQGATLGSAIAFMLGKRVFRRLVVRLAEKYPMFVTIDAVSLKSTNFICVCISSVYRTRFENLETFAICGFVVSFVFGHAYVHRYHSDE